MILLTTIFSDAHSLVYTIPRVCQAWKRMSTADNTGQQLWKLICCREWPVLATLIPEHEHSLLGETTVERLEKLLWTVRQAIPSLSHHQVIEEMNHCLTEIGSDDYMEDVNPLLDIYRSITKRCETMKHNLLDLVKYREHAPMKRRNIK